MNFPVKVYFPRAKGSRPWAKEGPKIITAKDQAELDALKRIGWSTEPSKEQ